MADKSHIEWTDATWNPVTGCTKVSPGCDNCYAETFAERFRGAADHYFENGFDLQLRPDKLDQPLRWRRPRRIFVNSMSDLFHKDIPEAHIARVFAVMAATPRHTFQILTKRHARMASLLSSADFRDAVAMALFDVPRPRPNAFTWPLPNVWLGVSVEDQKWADIRIPALQETPAAVRMLSCEPLLGPLDSLDLDGIGWVIVGGESGHGARPMEPRWARGIRDACIAASVPFFFKQWGNWAPNGWRGIGMSRGSMGRERLVGPEMDDMGHREVIERLGKKKAGRELDGRTWDEYPAGGTNEVTR